MYRNPKASLPNPKRSLRALHFCVLLLLLSLCTATTAQERRARVRPAQEKSVASFKFAVVGDNRGDSNGRQPAVYIEMLRAMSRDGVSFVLNTGDLINGFEEDTEEVLRRQWRGYLKTNADALRVPVYNAPGNHDIFNSLSAKLWREFLGKSFYSFDHSGARFIALDTETEKSRNPKTEKSWLGEDQFLWLERQLEEAAGRRVFIFLHKPLFPADAHIGTSLDESPAERDRLHRLFVRYARSIKGVFQGHEHMFYFEQRDGVPYYITGGGGAQLYPPPELGGFFHYLLVSVTPAGVDVRVRRADPLQEARTSTVAPAAKLEGWERPLFWYAWDHTARRALTADRASDGRQGLRLDFDMSRYATPLLLAPLAPPWDIIRTGGLAVDVYVPETQAGRLSVQTILIASAEHETPPVLLKRGWNTVTVDTRAANIPEAEARVVRQLQWVLSSAEPAGAGWVVFDSLRPLRAAGIESVPRREENETQMRESWEGPLLWGVHDSGVVSAERDTTHRTEGAAGLKLLFDLSKFSRPRLYARLSPLWDLSRAGRLVVDVYVPHGQGGALKVGPALRAADVRYEAPPVLLKDGWNRVAADLDGRWLPVRARSSAGQVEWLITSERGPFAGWVVFDNLRTEPK